MDTPAYFVIDIETCPINHELAVSQSEEDRKKLINPIDSKIVAIGIRSQDENIILMSDDEKDMLENFWLEWKTIKRGNPNIAVVGFNILNFDLPFIVTRSFVNNVTITPFILKEVIDLKEKLSAHRYGHTRGTLKEFGTFMGLQLHEKDGSDVMQLCLDKDFETLKQYLEVDLEITDSIYKRCRELNITRIARW